MGPGPYTLTISIAQTTQTNPFGFTTSVLVCTGTGPTSAAIPVDVTQEGGVWFARASSGTLVVRLTEVPGGVTGSMEGTSAHAGVSVLVNSGDGAPAALPPAMFSAVGAAGPVEGFVRFQGAQGDRSCSSNAWSLVPRS